MKGHRYNTVSECNFRRRGDDKHSYFTYDVCDNENGGITIEMVKHTIVAVPRRPLLFFTDNADSMEQGEDLVLHYPTIGAFLADFELFDGDDDEYC